MRRAAMLLVGLLLAACGPRIEFIRTGTGTPLSPRRSVRVFRDGDALPPFREVGYLEADQRSQSAFSTPGESEYEDALMKAAGQRGCNAVIIHGGCDQMRVNREYNSTTETDTVTTSFWARVSATCIVIAAHAAP